MSGTGDAASEDVGAGSGSEGAGVLLAGWAATERNRSMALNSSRNMFIVDVEGMPPLGGTRVKIPDQL